MTGSRESAMQALLSVIESAFPWAIAPSRRLRLWADVPAAERPCCFLFEGGKETYAWNNGVSPKRIIEAHLFVYVNSKDPDTPGAPQLNTILDALDAAFAPANADAEAGRLTLGGAAYDCRIEGAPFKDPGDLDGDGLLVAPLRIVLP